MSLYGLQRNCLNKMSKDVRFLAAILSVIFSLVVFLNHQPINPDAIYQYFPAADVFLKSGFSRFLQSFSDFSRWPFYSILIALLIKFFHLSFLNAAFVLNTIFNAITVVTFITLIQELDSRPAIVKSAAIVILAFHSFNAFRADIIRGFGYWAFLFLSLICFLRFSRTESWRYAVLWAVFMICGTLFRIEGAFLLCFSPFVLLFLHNRSFFEKVRLIIKAHALNIGLIGLLFIWLLMSGPHLIMQLGRFTDFVQQALQAYQKMVLSLQQHMQLLLPVYSSEKAFYVLTIGLLGYFVVSIVDIFTLLYSVLAIHGWVISSREVKQDDRRILMLITFLSLVPCFIFYLEGYNTSGRYLMPFCLLFSVWIPFSLVFIYESARRSKTMRWLFGLIVLILFVQAFSGLFHIFGPSNAYIAETGLWAKYHVPKNARLYTNHRMILFYANRKPWTKEAVQNSELDLWQFEKKWQQYDYYMIRVFKGEIAPEDVFLRQEGLVFQKVFKNRSGNKIFIFKHDAAKK
ncbi:MAG: hypothetical protein KKA99_02955 [Gammaproteobacteria bacterium]|nr:hypothetical protein [Gammaproteobacteria bacterium]MBU1926264.1 hypothetical protein [Gammaproteobacteria bacterium]MBU2546192.1 hypothetical protein [Gammaproteobacteria bacterium]